MQSTPTSRNPFGVLDAPDPDGADVVQFAASVERAGGMHDATPAILEGDWRSRWNGGADPTIAGDTPEAWKPGKATLKETAGRVYILFDWDNGRRRALVDARGDGPNRLMGRYINLSNPAITRPWAGVVVDSRRIDGHWTSGRLDFSR